MWMNVSSDDDFRRSIDVIFQINGTLSQLEWQKQQQQQQ